MTFQLTLTGRERGLPIPSDTMLSEALMHREAENRRQGAASGDTYGGKVRVRGWEGAIGSRSGVDCRFGIGQEGLEAYVG